MRCHSDGDHDDWLPHPSRRFHQCCGVKGRRLKGNCEPDPASAKRREMVEGTTGEPMNIDSDTEIDNKIPIKTVTFSNSSHCLETLKTYLMLQDVNNAIFSFLHGVEKELFRFRNQKDCEIHLQWASSHVNITGNEIADSLAKDGAAQHTLNSAVLTYSELHSTYINNKQSTIPPAHHRYEAKRPGGSLFLQCSRQEQTILTRFQSGHLRALTFRDGNKVFPTCVRCSACQASPEHILDCLGLSKQDLYEDPLMVLDFLRVNGIMDLV
ncbi:RNase H domain-containing protein [Trichonephila clavipes]|nr:RNase H domain-containing protein [Trichonephila clavipes]